MPTPRMTTTFKSADTTTFAKAGASSGSLKAVITGTIGDQSGVFYINVSGFIVRAKASIDAPIQVGDTVWVQKVADGWLITGVGA